MKSKITMIVVIVVLSLGLLLTIDKYESKIYKNNKEYVLKTDSLNKVTKSQYKNL